MKSSAQMSTKLNLHPANVNKKNTGSDSYDTMSVVECK